MRKLQFISLIVLLFSVTTFTSCDDEPIDELINLDDTNPPPGGSYFKADFSGETWNADNASVIFSGNQFLLTATKGVGGEGFSFILDGNTPGNYLANLNFVAFKPANSTFGYWGINPVDFNENTGSVTITSVNTVNQTVSGIFSYKGYWSDTTVTNILPIIFTNGVFNNLPYTIQNAPNNTFFAKVDGVDFVENTINVTTTNNIIGISATNETAKNITIGINDNATVGVHNITGNVATDVVQAFYKPSGAPLQAFSGSVNVTSKTTTRITGTFNFTSSNGPTQFQISQGQFDVDY